MYSTVNPSKVGFSKGARVLIGAVGAAKGACTPVGLLGADATLSMDKSFRVKNDMFPEIEVASALQSLSLTANIILREWTKQNLIYALDVASGDVTDVTATPVSITGEAYTPVGGVVQIPHAGPTSVVVKVATPATLVLNTDYQLMVIDGYTYIVRVAGSTAWADDTTPITVDYDYTPTAHSEMPLGQSGARNYYGVWIEEELTTSSTARTEYQIFRAAIGLDGGFNINSADNGGDLPIIIQASLASGQTALGTLYNYE